MSVLFTKAHSQQRRHYPDGTRLCLLPQLEHICDYSPGPGNTNTATCVRASQWSPSMGKATQGCRHRIRFPEELQSPCFPCFIPVVHAAAQSLFSILLKPKVPLLSQIWKKVESNHNKILSVKAFPSTNECFSYRSSLGFCSSSFHFVAPLMYSYHL